jgi:hypothetical protein
MSLTTSWQQRHNERLHMREIGGSGYTILNFVAFHQSVARETRYSTSWRSHQSRFPFNGFRDSQPRIRPHRNRNTGRTKPHPSSTSETVIANEDAPPIQGVRPESQVNSLHPGDRASWASRQFVPRLRRGASSNLPERRRFPRTDRSHRPVLRLTCCTCNNRKQHP